MLAGVTQRVFKLAFGDHDRIKKKDLFSVFILRKFPDGYRFNHDLVEGQGDGDGEGKGEGEGLATGGFNTRRLGEVAWVVGEWFHPFVSVVLSVLHLDIL